jgi:hypothetical protein
MTEYLTARAPAPLFNRRDRKEKPCIPATIGPK